MQRRLLLKLAAAASVSACQRLDSIDHDLHVVVAGAGIIGASIAYHLSKAGAAVTVLDKQGPATHASRGTFAWINATWAKQPRSYHSLNQQGLANWKQLEQVLDLPIHWGGSLEWFDSDARQNKLADQIAEQIDWGERASMLDQAAFEMLEPNVNFLGAKRVAFSENDGAIDPVVATKSLLTAAERHGAKVIYPCTLMDVSRNAGRLAEVTTNRGTIKADKLVLATGAAPEASKQFAGIDIPQRSTPGVIVITAPMPPLINRIIAAPGIHMHQRPDGRIILGEQDGAPNNTAHALRLKNRPNEFPNTVLAGQHAARMLSIAERFAPGIESAEVENVFIGWRPLPIDGHPVLGTTPKRPDVYMAIMHSGVSLAPIIGQLVAHEIVTGKPIEQLQAYRPTRQFQKVKHY